MAERMLRAMARESFDAGKVNILYDFLDTIPDKSVPVEMLTQFISSCSFDAYKSQVLEMLATKCQSWHDYNPLPLILQLYSFDDPKVMAMKLLHKHVVEPKTPISISFLCTCLRKFTFDAGKLSTLHCLGAFVQKIHSHDEKSEVLSCFTHIQNEVHEYLTSNNLYTDGFIKQLKQEECERVEKEKQCELAMIKEQKELENKFNDESGIQVFASPSGTISYKGPDSMKVIETEKGVFDINVPGYVFRLYMPGSRSDNVINASSICRASGFMICGRRLGSICARGNSAVITLGRHQITVNNS